MLFDRYDLIEVINLARRSDRRREMAKQFELLAIPARRYRFFEACAPADKGMFLSPGANGCFQSHLAILGMAAHADKSVLIVEDDCDFAPTARDFNLPDGVDIFYGGYEALDPDDLQASRIIGSHLMGFSRQGVRAAVDYLAGFATPGFRADAQAMLEPGYRPDVRPGIDGAYVWLRRARPELRVHFANPPIAEQRSSRSDVAPLRFYDRVPGLRLAAGVARVIRRQIGSAACF